MTQEAGEAVRGRALPEVRRGGRRDKLGSTPRRQGSRVMAPGLHPTTVANIGRGGGDGVRAKTMLALARGLGVNPGDLLAEPPEAVELPPA